MKISEGLTFDDVLLVPAYSDIPTRDESEVDIASWLSSSHKMHTPILSANMDTITEWKMANTMCTLGGNGIIHRFMTEEYLEDQLKTMNYMSTGGPEIPWLIAIGIGEKAKRRVDVVLKNIISDSTFGICIDVAHGDHKHVVDTVKWLKKEGIELVIAGNIATGDAACRLIDAGADVLKVGIGPGSLCTTRVVTGCGVPQLTAITEVKRAVDKLNPRVTIIGDGGIKSSGDIVKALAFGADSVMIGGLFAGTAETPGATVSGKKIYRGMASRQAQLDWKAIKPTYIEGETKTVEARGTVKDVVKDLAARVRSGFSYLGARNVTELRENATCIRISYAGLVESRPHGLTND